MVVQTWIVYCLKMYKISDKHKIHHRSHEKLESEFKSGMKNINRGENQEMHIPEKCTFNITICNWNEATQLHTLEMHFTKSLEMIHPLVYMDDTKLLAKNENYWRIWYKQ